MPQLFILCEITIQLCNFSLRFLYGYFAHKLEDISCSDTFFWSKKEDHPDERVTKIGQAGFRCCNDVSREDGDTETKELSCPIVTSE